MPDLSKMIAPLTTFLKTDKKFEWNDNNEQIRSKVIQLFKKNIRLSFPNINETFKLECDSSGTGLGYVLTQNHCIICIKSRKFTESEKNYSIIEKEFLAIKEVLTELRKIVLGCKIKIMTDNKALLNHDKITGNRIDRWK